MSLHPWRIGGRSVQGLVKSSQSGLITIASAASATATIIAVDVANSVVLLLGQAKSAGAFDLRDSQATLVLTNATTVTATRTSTSAVSCYVSYLVLEFWPGVIKSNQVFSITFSGSESAHTATLSKQITTTKAWPVFQGCIVPSTGDEDVIPYLSVVDATTVRANRGTVLTNNVTLAGTVLEFY